MRHISNTNKDNTTVSGTSPFPSVPGKKANRLHINLKGLGIFLFILMAIVALGLYVYKKSSSPANLNTGYTYHGLTDQHLVSSSSGKLMTFTKPLEFSKPAGQTKAGSESYLIQLSSADNKIVMGGVAAKVSENLSPSGAIYPVVTNPKLERVSAAMNNYLLETLGSGYSNKLTKVIEFKNNSIKSQAWQANLTTTSKINDQNAQSKKGTIIFVIGKSNYYYFMIYSLEKNWQPNQATWQKVLDSIKIDQ